MIYSKQIIEHLIAFIKEEASGFNGLRDKNLKELIFLKPALSGHEKATEWLINNKHYVLLAFVKAVRDDKGALRWLLDNKQPVWAATANAVNKDKGAVLWLKMNGFEHYVELAETLKVFFENDEANDLDSILRGPIK